MKKAALLITFLFMPFASFGVVKKANFDNGVALVDLPLEVDFEEVPDNVVLMRDNTLMQLEKRSDFNRGAPLHISADLYDVTSDYIYDFRGGIVARSSRKLDASGIYSGIGEVYKYEAIKKNKVTGVVVGSVFFLEHTPMVVKVVLPYILSDKDMRVKFLSKDGGWQEYPSDAKSEAVIKLRGEESSISFKLRSNCYAVDYSSDPVVIGQEVSMTSCEAGNLFKYKRKLDVSTTSPGDIFNKDGYYVGSGYGEGYKNSKEVDQLLRSVFLEYYIYPHAALEESLNSDREGALQFGQEYTFDFGLVFLGG